jgi:hypothetical protein
MINNQFLNYDLSLELKELGFNQDCLAGYLIADECQFSIYGLETNHTILKEVDKNDYLNSPFISQVFDWFRNKHNYICNITFEKDCFKFQYGYMGGGLNLYKTKYNSYKEAEIKCIEKMIGIIKNKTK